MEKLWLTNTEIAQVSLNIATRRSRIVVANSAADTHIVTSLVLPFIKKYFLETSAHVMSDLTIPVVAGLFINHLSEIFDQITIPHPKDAKNKTLAELASQPELAISVKELKDALASKRLDQFFSQLLSFSPKLKSSWKVAATDISSALLVFILDDTQEEIQRIYSEIREEDTLRFRTKIRIGSFLATFGYAEGDKITTIHNRKELNQMLRSILSDNGLRFKSVGEKKVKAIWKGPDGVIELDPKEVILSKRINIAVKRDQLKQSMPKLPGESADEYAMRITEQATSLTLDKMREVSNILRTLKPTTISKHPRFVRWSSFVPIDADLSYFHVKETSDDYYIVINDNFSLVLSYAPDFVRVLMELAKLQPLTKSKRVYNEYDGSGELDIDYTIHMMQKYGEFILGQREVLRFREKDKANFCFILDLSQSMARRDASICGTCSSPKAFSDSFYKSAPQNSHRVRNGLPVLESACYFCGHEFFDVASFRYSTFLFTIMIYLFKDFMKECLVGFIDYEFDKEIMEKQFYTFTDHESLLYYVWDVSSRKNPNSNYYTLGRLFTDYVSFFDGYNKKFVFIITDALAEDIFRQVFAIFSNNQLVYHDAFGFLKKLASNQLVNFIYCMITPPEAKEAMMKQMGFRKMISQNPFANNYSITLLKIYLKELVNSNAIRPMLRDVKDMQKYAEQYGENATLNTVRSQEGYVLPYIDYLVGMTSPIKTGNMVTDLKINSIPENESYSIHPVTRVVRITQLTPFLNLVKRIIRYEYDMKPKVISHLESGGKQIPVLNQTYQTYAQIDDFDRDYKPEPDPTKRNAYLRVDGMNVPTEFYQLMYHVWMLENWDKLFITDYFKLALTGELQRFVEIVKKRNLTDLHRKKNT